MIAPNHPFSASTQTFFSGLTIVGQARRTPARRQFKAACLRALAFFLLAFILSVDTASAEQLRLSFAEVAQTADLIFIGTASEQSTRLNDKRTMIFTDVFFKDVRIIHATERSVQKSSSVVRVTYAGGQVGDINVEVSDSPRFVNGKRYLIFMTDDGQTYSSPIIGGYQGLFEVVRDATSGQEYVLTAGRRAIIGADAEGLIASAHRVSSINGGSLVAEADEGAASARINSEPATPADSESSYSPRVVPSEKGARPPFTLAEFVDYIRTVALKVRLKERQIKRDGVGFFYSNNNGKIQAQRIKTSAPPVRILAFGPDKDDQPQLNTEVPRASTARSPLGRQPSGPSAVTGGPVGACTYHDLDLVMEQVPASWWEWQVVNDNMFVWNQAMDIFRYTDDDGSWGDNSQNEFAGYPTSADVNNQYGFNWNPGALAMHIGTDSGGCTRLDQSDICWNPAYSWTNDFSISLNGTAKLLRTVNQHETGHAWGAQRGTYAETYDYDVPTVMQGYSSKLIEDGWGIHSTDAYLIRRHYDDQRSINGTIRDVGVESYYASNGNKNSTTDATTYNPGDSITLNNITVENMTYNAVSDLRIRFFLSTNNVISTGDYQLGSYWFWNSFCAECYNVGNYTTTVPSNIPPGTYYVGAIVTINGFGNDDLTWNNSTYLYKTITVTCDGSFVFPTQSSDSFGAGGGSGIITMNSSGSACPWTASSDASWVTITSGSSGTGSGTVRYSVTANTGPGSRFTIIHVADLNYGVSQSPGCLSTTATSVNIGQTINGNLSSSDCLSPVRTRPGGYRPYADRYRFYAVAGQKLAFALSSSAFDTYLYLIGPNGSIITSDDDGGGGNNSRIPAESGNYTIPSNGYYTIEVTSYSENKVGNYSLSLIGTVIKFAISGRVKVGSANLAGVTMTLTGDRRFTPRTTNTLSDGTYSFANVPAGGDYTVTPSKTNYSFTPGSRTYATLNSDRTTADFAATLKTYSISGKIRRADSTVGLSAVAVKVTASGFTTRTYTTSSDGIYTFTGLPAGKSYTVKPTRTGYTFSPTMRSFPNLSTNQPIGAATSFAGTPN